MSPGAKCSLTSILDPSIVITFESACSASVSSAIAFIDWKSVVSAQAAATYIVSKPVLESELRAGCNTSPADLPSFALLVATDVAEIPPPA